MRYKVLQFWPELDANHKKLTDVNFAYFMYPHLNTAMFEKVIKLDHKIQGCKIFAQIGQGHFFWKIDYKFCHSVVSHHTKMFKLKKNP